MKTVLFLLICFLYTYPNAFAQQYKKTAEGIVVSFPANAKSVAKKVSVSVVSDKIFHVVTSDLDVSNKSKSLIVIHTGKPPIFTVSTVDDLIVLKTAALQARISRINGHVSFTDYSGKAILNESIENGQQLQPIMVDGQHLYQLQQSFDSPDDEAFYGLGQHQAGTMNYKNESVTLLQQNTDVAVPFLLSSKNYGILWDNYSISRVGDTRAYQPISSLKLYGKNGQPDGLTASYLIKDSNAPFLVQLEKEIEYKYLNDLVKLPTGYTLAKGTVEWEGSLEANESGIHKFFLFSSEYVKVWLDDKLLIDRWRQNWNPAQNRFDIAMNKGEKHKIKIEWKAQSSEAAISFQYLPPKPAADQNKFGFFSEAGNAIDYYFVSGNNMDEVISGYRLLTGKATMLPKWAMGFWQSRERYKTQEEILSTVAEYRKRGIGLDNIVLDWSYWEEDQWGSQKFDLTRFPDAKGMIDSLHNQYNTNLMISVWPKFYPQTDNYKLLDKAGFLYKRNIEIGRKDWINKGYLNTFYDAYNPGARKMFWDMLDTNLYKKGVDAWWMDASEPDIHSNVNIEDRKDFINPTYLGSSTQYFNAYALENAKGIYEGQRGVSPNKRVFILTRSGFAGLQRYAAATWSGDIAANWGDMKDQISAGVNFSMSGLPYWTMDIGGFAVPKNYESIKKMSPDDLAEWREQTTRWYQFGTFVPLFRAHGQGPFREIYSTAPDDHPAYKSILYYNQLRYRLMPYIYSLAGMVYQKDYSIMRGLPMDFPLDKKLTNINDQFMFGPSLLVNPVTEYKAVSRSVYLPGGTGWYNAYDGSHVIGGQTITADAPYERMPLFVKEGAIIPMGPAIQYTGQKQADTLTVFVYTGKDGTFTLYDDDGLDYGYEKGQFATIDFSYNESTKALHIGAVKGGFKGMLSKRTINVVFVNKENRRALDADSKADKTIIYTGKTVGIKVR
jgi:alpha-D-xyloside xylohydrolase